MDLKKLNIISKYSVEIELHNNDTNIEVVSKNNEDYEFFMNGIKKNLGSDTEQKIIRYIVDNIDQDELEWVITNEDYNNIYSKLTFEEICGGYHQDKDLMIKLISSDLQFFIEHEKYEKCAVLQNLLDKVNKL